MFPKNTMKIVELILRTPKLRYNVNQIAKELRISVGSAHENLTKLSEKGMLNRERIGNQIIYTINFNPEMQRLCELAIIESRKRFLNSNPIAKVYSKDVESFDAKATVLFGSILTKGEDAKDVDVLFVIKKRSDANSAERCAEEISSIRTRPLIPLIMTGRDFKENIKKGNRVVFDIIKTGLVLKGESFIVDSIK